MAEEKKELRQSSGNSGKISDLHKYDICGVCETALVEENLSYKNDGRWACKQCMRDYASKPENKEKQRARRSTPEYRAVRRAYDSKPENKEKQRARRSTPDGKARHTKNCIKARNKRRGQPSGIAFDAEAALEEQGGKCYYCLTPFSETNPSRKPHVEHMVPLAQDGWDCASNICLACRRCNFTMGALPFGEALDMLVKRDLITTTRAEEAKAGLAEKQRIFLEKQCPDPEAYIAENGLEGKPADDIREIHRRVTAYHK